VKRAFDLAIAVPALVVSSPVIGALALAVKLDSPGPVFYRGVRVGRGGREFQIVKLRSMVAGADRKGPAVTAAGDARVTRVGAFLRRTKLDELPQLWNVVVGDMSLVGPRPEHPSYVSLYTPEQRRVLAVRPGITSPASLAFRDEESILAAGGGERAYAASILPRKLELDLQYVDRQSVLYDLSVLLRTAGIFVWEASRKARRSSSENHP
jgi:lipopolysaccharide/colanic/teichoic acid biosynthesis glycosyltransferase